MRPSAPPYIADFDSASAMLRATSNCLKGKDYPTLGKPRALKPLVRSVNATPKKMREGLFAMGGAFEGIGTGKLGQVDAEKIAKWAAARYPKRSYQGVMIGSSNGALVHLAAAFDMPWLPQNALIPVRRMGGDSDDPKSALAFGAEHAQELLQANPDIKLHHMHDANQDRLMVKHMEYFRVKRLTLGRAYEQFLQSRLPPGGTIIIVNCERKWPTSTMGDRHVFQHGALGGATEDEFMHGGERVEEYLERYQANVRQWDSPTPDGDSPEAEWGFDAALQEDILRFAAQHGYKVQRLSFYEPEHLGPPVADFYRDWYRERGMKANRLLVESFVMMEPYWALRTGSVPFWMKFNMDPSAEALERYLDKREPFDDINIMLFNEGVEAVGFPQVGRWKAILEKARRRGRIIGAREDLYPRDFGSLARYHSEIKQVPARYPLPGALPLSRLSRFLERSDRPYDLRHENLRG